MWFEAVIGLEVHAQLSTKSKLFCACSTRFGQEPNSHVCPVCAGMPGALPVMNKKAVEYAAKMALAVDCTVNRRSIFARKNYFYPDLPKGYQISQYEIPLAENGHLDIETEAGEKRVGIVRIHMEDDAGKSIHSPAENMSFVDLNRTGVPLIEIVSGPDLASADEAVAYLKGLRSILLYLGISDANMEEGNFRCDANVSIRPRGDTGLGTRAELKNMNSFRHVHKALEYEISRQVALVEDGEEVVQETRLFDQDKGQTRPMRGKEEAHDYRYFPDPDLVPVAVDEEELKAWREGLPELPRTKARRFAQAYGLSSADARLLTQEQDLADYFEAAAAQAGPKEVSNWMLTEMQRELKERDMKAAQVSLRPEQLAALINLIARGTISNTIGKQIFPELFTSGEDPETYVQARGLSQISDQGELDQVVDEVLDENPEEVQSYLGGKSKLLSFFMGQVMKKTKGQANPKMVNSLLEAKLEAKRG
ncbi:Asp-tRNA(Asn)/Glu-tRNA(Gln) amidotransferase subunit GatB [Desulfovermiculus halophilus]|jgi:aspartyl-tRNA(Asn)/glutamyl-tRNA(Gln) amidotransferase subunit B|uniref:Asp-tRNA(Asn)/Glu-tRNA(Gln) amidotransferase subunit GatB n=1 Tax=Desulfovermiculus halophilus TaxID=339722 RepID=UPI000482574B|nr:Asp-tRNA(Asn)/Glu-tRNA(Gln) amidotransferase subunit GatB [Desulfovermiculus halophilus]